MTWLAIRQCQSLFTCTCEEIYIWRQLEGLGLVMCFTRWCTMGGDARTMKNGILLLVLLQQEYTSVLLPETTKNCRWLCWDSHKRHALCYIVTDWAYTSHHLHYTRLERIFKLIAQESCCALASIKIVLVLWLKSHMDCERCLEYKKGHSSPHNGIHRWVDRFFLKKGYN